MGWLRDLMNTSEPPVASFGRLAAAALAHPAWPEDTRPQARSLATLFSKLDRDQDLDWLADRVEVQRVLAELLNRPVADVQQALPVRRAQSSARLVRLDDLRYGRELDLGREALCPGLPSRVLDPPSWGRLSWRAPSGSGRSLAGAWLAARGLAQHLTIRRLSSDVELPSHGPLFVELTDPEPGLLSQEELRAWLAPFGAERRPICIASVRTVTAPGWDVVESPPVASVLPELVSWVAERLPDDGHFEPERALAWMQRVAFPAQAVLTLGDALGLLGMLDEVRPRTLHGRSLDEIAESFVRQRLAESSEETTVSSWLNRNAFAALLGTIAQLVTESDQPWNHPRTFDEWLALIPEEYREGIDVDWMRAALARDAGQKLRESDLAAAARKLPPGGYQLLRALEHARILSRDNEHLRLRPHWLGTTLEARATHQLVTTSPAAWGEALLRPAHAPRVLHVLLELALRGDFSTVHAALELDGPESPAHAAAIEAATTVVGVAAGAGLPVPSDLALDLLAEQEELALVLPGEPPRPRVAHQVFEHGEPLLDPAAWLLGVYLLSVHAGRPRGVLSPLSHLRPEPRRALLRLRVYPTLLCLLRSATARRAGTQPSSVTHPLCEVRLGPAVGRYPWTLTIYSLVDSLRSNLGPAGELPTELELPAVLAEALAADRCTSELLHRLSELPLALPALVDRARARGVDWPTFHRRFWRSLDPSSPLPALIDPSQSTDGLAAELWREAPPDWVKRRVGKAQPIAWSALLPHHYAALLNADFALPIEVARLAPVDALFEATGRRGLDAFVPEARRALWQRSPKRMLSWLAQTLDARRLGSVPLLLESASEEQLPEILSALGTRIDLTAVPLADLHPLRRWLADVIARRTRGWGEAYALLHRVEVALEPLRSQFQ